VSWIYTTFDLWPHWTLWRTGDIVMCIGSASCAIVFILLFTRSESNQAPDPDCCSARCYASAAYAVMWCLSICLRHIVNSVKMSNYVFQIFSLSDSHTILVFPYQTSWQYSDCDSPYGGIECRWGRQKSQLLANIWLHCVLWTIWPPSAINSAATDHGKLMTLVAGKWQNLLMTEDVNQPDGIKVENWFVFFCITSSVMSWRKGHKMVVLVIVDVFRSAMPTSKVALFDITVSSITHLVL